MFVHDLVIRNGRVVDRSGANAHDSDLVISRDRIVDVAQEMGRGPHEFDADGLLVTPDWVVVHTHDDAQASWDRHLPPSSWHGDTTAVRGNCGVGVAPAAPERHEWPIEVMDGVEDIPGSAMTEDISWDRETFPEYPDAPDGDLSFTYEVHRHPHTPMGLDDADAHCGVICDGGTPTFMLTHWTRDRTRGPRVPLAHVVHRQTRQTAEMYGLRDLGLLAPGCRADVNVIDLDALGFRPTRMVHDLTVGTR